MTYYPFDPTSLEADEYRVSTLDNNSDFLESSSTKAINDFSITIPNRYVPKESSSFKYPKRATNNFALNRVTATVKSNMNNSFKLPYSGNNDKPRVQTEIKTNFMPVFGIKRRSSYLLKYDARKLYGKGYPKRKNATPNGNYPSINYAWKGATDRIVPVSLKTSMYTPIGDFIL